jgi:signal transduction histidine kinase
MSLRPDPSLDAPWLPSAGHAASMTAEQAVPGVRAVLVQSTWRQRLLLALAVGVPFAIAALFAFHHRAVVISEAHESARRSVVALEQHAANVIDAHALILRQLTVLVNGLSDGQIRNDQLLRVSLADFSRDFDQISAIVITDGNGNRLTSSPDATLRDSSLADRDFFVEHRKGEASGMLVSQAFAGGTPGEHHFALSVARMLPSGDFGGVIVTAIPLAHFTSFWKQFTPSSGYLIPMVRPDGALIVRYPHTDSPLRLDPRGPFISHLSASSRGLYTAVSNVDGVERINAYSQVRNYPLYVSFSVESATVLQIWHQRVGVAASLALVMALLLVALWLAVVRHSHMQRRSAAAWEDAARAFENEIALREQAQKSARAGVERVTFGNQLIGIVSHDLRNPLNTILLSANVLARRGALGSKDAQLVQRIQNAAERAAGLVRDLLDFTLTQMGGRIPVQRRAMNLHDLLHAVLAELEAAHPGRVACLLDADDPRGEWDPDRLSQVVENLVSNALKYGAADGVVRVRTVCESRALRLEVHNEGEPIPAGKLRAIFEPLQRGAEASQPNPDRSIGIGLYIVRHIVEAHGGTVEAESATGLGTTFVVRLPRTQ